MNAKTLNFSGCGDVRRGLEWAADLLSASDNECYVNSPGWLRVKTASCGLSTGRREDRCRLVAVEGDGHFPTPVGLEELSLTGITAQLNCAVLHKNNGGGSALLRVNDAQAGATTTGGCS